MASQMHNKSTNIGVLITNLCFNFLPMFLKHCYKFLASLHGFVKILS